MKKIKTYVLIVSRTFPRFHPNEGECTRFVTQIKAGVKKHTIRLNSDYWQQRIDEVNAGNAMLSLRHWDGKPYRSKQVEFAQLKQGEVGYERVKLSMRLEQITAKINGWFFPFDGIPENDGLTEDQFKHWFFPQLPNIDREGIIIHFTDFRYVA